jgi:peptidoglycan/xylan/chitin deacetylase (PgdA/CDA1 family)
LGFDDFLLRDKWASVPTVSDDRLKAELDFRVLDLAERFGLRTTIFVSGSTVKRFPTLAKELVERGHEVAGHGMTHEDLRRLRSSNHVEETISSTLAILEQSLGKNVEGWKHPGLFQDGTVRRGLSKSRVKWCTGTKIPLDVARLGCDLSPFADYGSKVEIPAAPELVDYDLYMHMRFSSNRFVQTWTNLTSRFRSSVLVFTVHPWLHLMEEEDRLKALGRVFEHFASRGTWVPEGEIYQMFRDGRIKVNPIHQFLLRLASRTSEKVRNRITARPAK